MKDKLTFIAASAGTGKTFRLVQEVKEAVLEGRAQPGGIVATTFTRAAANEMQERLAKAFHEDGLHDEALALENGLVSTVHGICFQLLSRFAFEAGLSPDVHILDESEANLLLNHALDEVVEEAVRQELYALASRLSERNDRTGQWHWRRDVKSIVETARSNDIAFDRLPAMGHASWSELEKELGPVTTDDLDTILANRVNEVLAQTADSTLKNTKAYRDVLRNIARDIHAPWKHWAYLLGKKPEVQFHPEANEIAAIAARVGEHPRLRADLSRYLELLFHLAAEVGNQFTALKKERGAADFADLEKEALDLLRNHPGVREILAEEIDLLLVDEFQDTSPIQLAIFTELGKLADRIIWVGDVKQSIYGFRHADPELVFQAVAGAGTTDSLETSWRSVPDLVSLSNRLFASPFHERQGLPEEQTTISAHRVAPASWPPAIELAEISSGAFYNNGNPKPLTGPKKARLIADAAEDLLQRSAPEVVIKSSITPENREGITRALQPGDLAILVRSGFAAVAIAETLRARGHDVALSGSGLLATPEANLALACLRRWLDPGDSMAAAEVVALEARHPTEEWLEDRLRYVDSRSGAEAAEPWLLESSPALVALHQASDAQSARLHHSPLASFDQAVAVAEVERIVSCWGPTTTRSEQRLANLEKLRSTIEEYETRTTQSGLPATCNGLFGWLADLAEDEDDQLARFESRGAIHVGTYHSAKGLEWPVVLLADLEFAPRSRLFGLRVITAQDGTHDYDQPLAGRELRRWIPPFADRQKHPLLDHLQASPLGCKAKQDEKDEALRLLYVGFTRARDRLVLFHEPGKDPAWLAELGDDAVAALLDPESGVVLQPDTSPLNVTVNRYQSRPEPEPPTPATTLDLPLRSAAHTPREPAALTPSAQSPIEGATIGEILEYGPRIEWTGHPNDRDLGDAMHRILAAEVLHPAHPDREARFRAILAAFSLEKNVDATAVAHAVDRYLAFIEDRFKPTAQRVEVPFTVVNEPGQRITGFIDHLLETEAGPVIIDHKIFPGKRSDWETKALSYSGQLALYRNAVDSNHPPKTLIHFVTSGSLVPVEP